jgi:hypothetical protein
MFYDMVSLDLLLEPRLAEKRVADSPAFLRLRPQLRDVMRDHYRVAYRSGGGVAGYAATVIFETRAPADAVSRHLQELCQVNSIRRTALHIGLVEPNVPVRIGQTVTPRSPSDLQGWIVVVESFEKSAAMQAAERLSDAIHRTDLAGHRPRYGSYELGLALRFDELERAGHRPMAPVEAPLQSVLGDKV